VKIQYQSYLVSVSAPSILPNSNQPKQVQGHRPINDPRGEASLWAISALKSTG